MENPTLGAHGETTFEALLVGGPRDIAARTTIKRVHADEVKIKIPWNGGYEHFERDGEVVADRTPVVYRWTGRTKIAE